MNSPALEQTRAGQLLRQGHVIRLGGCQVSPLVTRIRDDGPALLDGDCVHECPPALLERLPANSMPIDTARNDYCHPADKASGCMPAANTTRRSRTMIISSVVILSLSLVCVGTYAWQQKYQVAQLEAELLLLEAAERN